MSNVDLGPASCETCMDYLAGRRAVLDPHVRAQAQKDGEMVGLTWLRFMRGVHGRHLRGLSLAVSA